MRITTKTLWVAVLVLAGCAAKKKQSTASTTSAPTTKAEQPPVAAPAAPAPTPGKDGWVKLSSGLQYKDKKAGSGAEAKSGQDISVLYKGWLDNGKVFDASSKHGGEPFSFSLGAGGVIRGWDEGVQGMKVGGVRELKIPPELGYGDQELPSIPAGSTLHFEVHLLKVGG